LEGFRDVKSDLPKVDKDYDPVALTQGLFVVWLLRGHKEELKHVTYVHILADVCQEKVLRILEVKQVAQVDEVKLITLSHLEGGPGPIYVLKDFLNVFVISRPFEALCLLDFDVHHLY
jgi:hypothetical protein